MKIYFLGTNGWYCTKTGETLCTLIDAKEGYVILDAGNSFYKLKKYLNKDKPAYLFISHIHLDHICGVHQLAILEKNIRELDVYLPKGTKKFFETIGSKPYTAPLSSHYPVKITELEEGTHTSTVKFECAMLRHVEVVFGYRFYLEGKIISLCTDSGPCENILKLAKDADMLITECAFLPGEQGEWGHLNPMLAGEIAKEANAKRLILTHFDAARYTSIEQRKKAEKIARKIFPNTTVAIDDLEIEV